MSDGDAKPEPASVNKPTDPVERLIYEVAAASAIKKAEASAPWLKWPVIAAVFRLLVDKISAYLYAELSAHVNFILIDSEVAKEKAAYDKAVKELRDAHAYPTSDLQKKEVEEAFKKTLANLIWMRPHEYDRKLRES
jgi:hypothetical protein